MITDYKYIYFEYCIVVYETKEQVIIFKLNKNGRYDDKKIGDITSFGWTIIDVQFIVNKQFHKLEYLIEYQKKQDLKREKRKKRKEKIKKIVNFLKDVT